jgi:hypothetical protein
MKTEYPKLTRISEKQYVKNPEKWDVHFIAWDTKGKPYAMAEEKIKPPEKNPPEN